MPYKKIIYPLLVLFALFVVLQLGIGMIPWHISVRHHDYPGPKLLTNIKDKHVVPEWILIHGANMDARQWKILLDKHQNIPMVALSLSHHEEGPQFAYPNQLAPLDLNHYLKAQKPQIGVIGQSTAALWIADAYLRCPSCWAGLKIILLAPNAGTNIKSYYQMSFYFLPLLQLILPNPYWAFTPITACKGVDNQYYEKCKKNYLFGRLFRFASISYYQKLFTYMAACHKIHTFENFLRAKHQDIKIYVGQNDLILNSEMIVKLAEEFKISSKVLPQTSHYGITMKDDIWLF